MVSAGVMGSNFLTVNPSTETSSVEKSDSKVNSFKGFMDSAKADNKDADTDLGCTKGDKAEEIKNLFEKSNVNQSSAPEKITEDQLIEAAEDVVADFIKNVIDVISEVMEIDKEEVENAIKELDLDASTLLNKNGLSELMKQLTGKENVIELLTNSELSDMFKNIVSQVDEMTKLFMETNSINKEQLIEMVSEIDIQSIVTDENVVVSDEDMVVEFVNEEIPQEKPVDITKETISYSDDEMTEVAENKLDFTQNKIESEVTKNSDGREMSQNNQTLAQSFAESLVNAIEEIDVDMDIEPQQIIRQIVDEIRTSVGNEVSSIDMQLNPENLGKLNIQLVSKNGEVTANIMAQSEAVKEVIESQVTMLKETLLEQGVKIEAVEVVVANRSFDEDFENQERQNDEQKPKKHISQKELDEINGVQSVQDIIEEEMMLQNGNTVSIKA